MKVLAIEKIQTALKEFINRNNSYVIYFDFSTIDICPKHEKIVQVIDSILEGYKSHHGYIISLDQNGLLIFMSGVEKDDIDNIYHIISIILDGEANLSKEKIVEISHLYGMPGDFSNCLKRVAHLIKSHEKNPSILDEYIKEIDISSFGNLKEERKNRSEVHVLIVEDQIFTQKLLSQCIPYSSDYQTHIVSNAIQALDYYIEQAPDIIFLDWNLPGCSGFELLKKIMEIDPEAYIVMTTGNTNIDDVKSAINLGAKGYIAKPITRQKVELYLKRFLDHSGKLRV